MNRFNPENNFQFSLRYVVLLALVKDPLINLTPFEPSFGHDLVPQGFGESSYSHFKVGFQKSLDCFDLLLRLERAARLGQMFG